MVLPRHVSGRDPCDWVFCQSLFPPQGVCGVRGGGSRGEGLLFEGGEMRCRFDGIERGCMRLHYVGRVGEESSGDDGRLGGKAVFGERALAYLFALVVRQFEPGRELRR